MHLLIYLYYLPTALVAPASKLTQYNFISSIYFNFLIYIYLHMYI